MTPQERKVWLASRMEKRSHKWKRLPNPNAPPPSSRFGEPGAIRLEAAWILYRERRPMTIRTCPRGTFDDVLWTRVLREVEALG